jgi:hypothetical protein
MRASFVASMPVLGATKRLTANGGRYLCENAAEVRLGLPQVFCLRIPTKAPCCNDVMPPPVTE